VTSLVLGSSIQEHFFNTAVHGIRMQSKVIGAGWHAGR
jgi:hypothetical protein